MGFENESGDESDSGKVRVKFVTKLPSIRVTETPIAVPGSLQRYGLSEVVNHLLGRDPPTPFDMLVMGRFLRSSLSSAMRKNALSGEAVLEVEYLPALRQPTEAENADQPDWVSAVAPSGQETFATSCYDGCIRVYGAGCKVTSLVTAHNSPVTALCAIPKSKRAERSMAAGFLSGSKDMTAKLWRLTGSSSNASLKAVAVLRGHGNSISSVQASAMTAYTGDWDGHICMWDVASALEGTPDDGGSTKGAKRRKTGKSDAEATVPAQLPKAGFRAHAQAVMGLAGPSDEESNTLYSASLDRAIKTWDAERQDCVNTLNAPKAVTCLSCSSSGRMLATGHPDAQVRIWDTRTQGETLTRASLRSHKQWVASVAWASGSETTVLSCAHDGAVKLWDVRSTIPLHSAQAHDGKALCCSWLDGRIISGGTDGAVKTFVIPNTQE